MKSSKLLGSILRAPVLRSEHFSSITRSQDLPLNKFQAAHFSPAQTSLRQFSSAADPANSAQQQQQQQDEQHHQQSTLSQYWGIVPKERYREDGTPWHWNCFRPQDTYVSNLNVDLKKHHIPDSVVDKLALRTVKFLRKLSDMFFQRRHGCHAVLLETVAAVPGMVGGMLLHFKSLRRFEHSGGWIKALLEEAENERMHLMTFMEVYQPKWYERTLVLLVQGVFFNGYFLLYILSPRLAHRVTGYLEEEAVISYTEFLKDLDSGSMPNGPAPAIAIDYWRLPKEATLREVVAAVRADETRHRDVNHFAADVHHKGKELREAPVPHYH